MNNKLIKYYEHLEGSTQDLAKKLALAGAPTGTTVLVNSQIGGYGRFKNRKFICPPNIGLWFSLILRIKNDFKLSVIIPVAILEAIAENTGINLTIKWPNDLLFNGKKVVGILLEGNLKYSFIIAGIGINVNNKISDFPIELRGKATSLFLIKNKIIYRQKLFIDILKKIKYYLGIFKLPLNYLKIWEKWKENSYLLNKNVSFKYANQLISGIVVDFTKNGNLILKKEDGEKLILNSGEITFH